jgi:hypothetical protein
MASNEVIDANMTALEVGLVELVKLPGPRLKFILRNRNSAMHCKTNLFIHLQA